MKCPKCGMIPIHYYRQVNISGAYANEIREVFIGSVDEESKFEFIRVEEFEPVSKWACGNCDQIVDFSVED